MPRRLGTANWCALMGCRRFREPRNGWNVYIRKGGPKPLLRPLPRLNVEAVLDALHLRKWFRASTAAEDVQAGKPDPQVFLIAASRLNAAPGICIVVEDAWADV